MYTLYDSIYAQPFWLQALHSGPSLQAAGIGDGPSAGGSVHQVWGPVPLPTTHHATPHTTPHTAPGDLSCSAKWNPVSNRNHSLCTSPPPST